MDSFLFFHSDWKIYYYQDLYEREQHNCLNKNLHIDVCNINEYYDIICNTHTLNYLLH